MSESQDTSLFSVRPKVLIVDDVAANLKIFRDALQPQGYEILVATSGKAALRTAVAASPDLILLDVMMPEMNGYEVCQELKQNEATADIPIIFVTAKEDTQSVVEGFCVGGVDYITKPFEHSEVRVRLQTHLTIKRLRDELKEKNDQLEVKNEALEKSYETLQQAQAELVQSEKMAALGHLAAGIAHEMNNPLGAVKSAVDVCTRCLDKIMSRLETSDTLDEIRNSKPFQQSIEILIQNQQITVVASDRIGEIVTSMRNFTRLDEAEFQFADIHAGILSSLTLLNHHFKDRITVHKAFSEIPKIPCYPAQLNQVIMYLLQTAGNAIEGKGDVWIHTWSEDDFVKLSIRDNSKGIEQDMLPRIFDPFVTINPADSGRGFGLAVSRRIIEGHSGTIEVESEVGKGTEFVVTLPIKLAEEC